VKVGSKLSPFATIASACSWPATLATEHEEHGVDWIKLFPGGNYSFLPNGELNFVTTYRESVK
jgi:hypothetical protein